MSALRSWPRRVARPALGLALVAGSLSLIPATTASAAPKAISTKVSAADPGFNRFGKTYYIYATGKGGKNFPVFSSTSATGSYHHYSHGALKVDPPKLKNLWAPHVIQRGSTYFMFFSAQPAGHEHCLYYSTSPKASGGFGTPHRLFCGRTEGGVSWEAIDPSTYTEGSTTYLVWRSGHVKAFPTGDYDIQSRKLAFSGSKVTTGAKINTLVSVRNGPVIEAPDVIRHDGKLYLFVSRGRYDTNDYRTDVYRGSSIAGKFGHPKPLMRSGKKYGYGPGGAEVLGKPSNKVYIAYHTWTKNSSVPHQSGVRLTRTAEVVWSGTTPRVK